MLALRSCSMSPAPSACWAVQEDRRTLQQTKFSSWPMRLALRFRKCLRGRAGRAVEPMQPLIDRRRGGSPGATPARMCLNWTEHAEPNSFAAGGFAKLGELAACPPARWPRAWGRVDSVLQSQARGEYDASACARRQSPPMPRSAKTWSWSIRWSCWSRCCFCGPDAGAVLQRAGERALAIASVETCLCSTAQPPRASPHLCVRRSRSAIVTRCSSSFNLIWRCIRRQAPSCFRIAADPARAQVAQQGLFGAGTRGRTAGDSAGALAQAGGRRPRAVARCSTLMRRSHFA